MYKPEVGKYLYLKLIFDIFRIDMNAINTGGLKASTYFMLLFSIKVKTVFSF